MEISPHTPGGPQESTDVEASFSPRQLVVDAYHTGVIGRSKSTAALANANRSAPSTNAGGALQQNYA